MTAQNGRRRNWTVGFIVWRSIGLSFASRSYFTYYRDGVIVPWYEIFSAVPVDCLYPGCGFAVDFFG